MIKRDAAIVLSGGGAYGAYEVGIVKALVNGETSATNFRPLDPGILTGTSAGAINAAILASRPQSPIASTVDYLEKLWMYDLAEMSGRFANGAFRVRLDPFQYIDSESLLANPARPFTDLVADGMSLARTIVRRGANFLLSTGSIQVRALESVDVSALISTEQLAKTLRAAIDLDGIRDSERLLRIAATNWDTGVAQIFSNQDLANETGYAALQASASIPGLFPSVAIGGSNYVDGGLVLNTPLKPAIDCGAHEIHVVYLDPLIENMSLTRLQSSLDIFDRALAIGWAAKTNHDVENAAWINKGISALERIPAQQGSPDGDLATFYRTASRILERIGRKEPYRKLTIHRYHPHDDFHDGIGALDFNRKTIANLIERGYKDGLRHDCRSSGCIIGD
jgi:NTE family protein